MKVLFLSAWYPHRNDPMSGLFVRKHAEAVALYATTAVLYVVPDKNICKAEIVSNVINGISEFVVYFPLPRTRFFYRFFVFLNFLKAYIAGFHILYKIWGKPDIIQANVFTRTALIALYVKIVYKIPYVVIEHWTRYFRTLTFQNFIHKYFSIIAAKNAAAVLPVTRHLQTCMQFHGMKNCNYQVINNVVDNMFFENFDVKLPSKIRIINVTCFNDDQKNLTGILRVISKLYKKRQDFDIHFVGDGVDYTEIVTYAKNIGLDESVVTFTGLLMGESLVKEYQQSNFSLLFSNYENIPVVISESLACGIPVISTNVGGISEHINESNGLLIDAKNEKALFESIDFMLNNYEIFKRESLTEVAKQKYSYQSIGNKLYNIYLNILES